MSKRRNNNYKATGLSSFFNGFLLVCVEIISRIGFPGFVLLFYFFALTKWANELQKKIFIDKWILFNWANKFDVLPIILVILAIFVSQTMYYRRKLKLLNDEVIRVSVEKSKLQEMLIQKQLHHS